MKIKETASRKYPKGFYKWSKGQKKRWKRIQRAKNAKRANEKRIAERISKGKNLGNPRWFGIYEDGVFISPEEYRNRSGCPV